MKYITGLHIDRLIYSLKELNRPSGLFENVSTNLTTLNIGNAPELIESGDFELQLKNIRPRNYDLFYNLYFKGSLFGFIKCGSRCFQSQHLIGLEIDQKALYTTPFSSILQSFYNTFNLDYNNITYLEIAMDTNCNLIKRNKLFNKKYKLISKAKNFGEYEGTTTPEEYQRMVVSPVKGECTQYIGGYSKKGNGRKKHKKQLRLENKSKELECSQKSYIKDWHKQLGFDESDTIYRAELVISGDVLKKSQGLTNRPSELATKLTETLTLPTSELQNQLYLFKVFLTLSEPIFRFKNLTENIYQNFFSFVKLGKLPDLVYHSKEHLPMKQKTDTDKKLKKQIIELKRLKKINPAIKNELEKAIKELLNTSPVIQLWYKDTYISSNSKQQSGKNELFGE